jgi:hypothetical protein
MFISSQFVIESGLNWWYNICEIQQEESLIMYDSGTYKVRNEINENETKQNEINEMKRNQWNRLIWRKWKAKNKRQNEIKK